MSDSYYVDALGNLKPEYINGNTNDLNINKIRMLRNTRMAQIDDMKLKTESQKIQLLLVSVLAGVSLLTILVLLRNLKN